MFRKSLYILILLISSLVFSSNDALACCSKSVSSNEKIEATISVHSVEMQKVQVGHCCCNHFHEDKEKPHSPCGNCDCNCIHSISYINSEFSMELDLVTITSYFTYGWHYNQPLPDKPLYSIWQPPQLS